MPLTWVPQQVGPVMTPGGLSFILHETKRSDEMASGNVLRALVSMGSFALALSHRQQHGPGRPSEHQKADCLSPQPGPKP